MGNAPVPVDARSATEKASAIVAMAESAAARLDELSERLGRAGTKKNVGVATNAPTAMSRLPESLEQIERSLNAAHDCISFIESRL